MLDRLDSRRRAHIGAYLGFKPNVKAQDRQIDNEDIDLLIKTSKETNASRLKNVCVANEQ